MSIFLFPVDSIFFIIFFVSHGDRNCPFFTFTILFVFATAITKSVCLHKNAGIWITSSTFAASFISSLLCTSDNIGRFSLSFIFFNLFQPFCSIAALSFRFNNTRACNKQKRIAISNSYFINLHFFHCSVYPLPLSFCFCFLMQPLQNS